MRLAKKDRAQEKKISNYSALQKIQQVPGPSPPIRWFGPPHRGQEGPRPPLLLVCVKPVQLSLVTTWKHWEEEEMFHSGSNESAQWCWLYS